MHRRRRRLRLARAGAERSLPSSGRGSSRGRGGRPRPVVQARPRGFALQKVIRRAVMRGRRRDLGGALLLGPLVFRWTTCVRLDHLSSVGPPGRLFRGGFEDVEREGRGDGPVVGTVPRPTPLRPCWSSCMVGRGGGRGDRPPPAGPAASTTGPPIPPRPTPPSTLEGDSSGPSQPVSASSAPPNDYPYRTWEASDASRVTFQRPSEVLEYD